VGRASGPFMFTQTFETLTDNTKTFIAFSNLRENAFLTEKTSCNKIWSNNYSPKNIMNMLITELNKLEG
jgi:hypothetical protein